MREIPLTQGYTAIIDEADWPLVQSYRWQAYVRPQNRTVYAKANSKTAGRRTVVWLHRLIAAPGPTLVVDHINGDGLDNRRANLRICTHAQNLRNRRPPRHSPLGLKGVIREGRRFRAIIMVNKRQLALGAFACPNAAGRTYDRAALEHFGEFARLNFAPSRDWLFPHEIAGAWPPEPPA